MAFDVEGAKQAGYSDAEINSYLAKETNFDLRGARRAGYRDDEILKHLISVAPSKQKEAPPPEPLKTGPTVLPESDTSSDFLRGIKNYLPQLQELGGAAEALTGVAASKLGAKETGKSLTESGLKTMEAGQAKAVSKESDAFLNAWEKGIGTVVTDWLPYQMGSGVANIAETLGFMGLGALAGTAAAPGGGTAAGAVTGAVSKILIKKGIKDAAKEVLEKEGKEAAEKFIETEAKKAIIEKAGKETTETYSEQLAKDYAKSGAKKYGATAGMAGQAGLAGAGEVGSRVFEEEKRRAEAEGREFRPEDIDMARVAPSVAVHAVADYFFNKIGLDAMKIGEQATKSLALDIAKRIAVTGAKQIPAEELQTLAERYGAGLSLTDKQALEEYINTAAAAVGMSVVPGTVGGARTNFEGAQKKALEKLTEELKNKTQEKTEENKQVEQPPAGRNLTITENGQAVTPAAPVEKAPAVQRAEEYIAKIDSGEVQPTAPILGAMLTNLGIERPTGGNFREKAVKAIKDHLAAQGEQNVAGTVTTTSGEGAGVVSPPAANVPAGGTVGTQLDGVAGARAPITDTGAGTAIQPTPLVPTTEPTKPYSEWNRPKRVQKQAPIYAKKLFPGDESKDLKNPDLFPGYQYDPTKSEEENVKAALKLQEQNEAGQEEQRVQALTDVRVRALKEQQEADARKAAGDKPKIVAFKVTPAKQAEYERTRQKLDEEGITIPLWKELSQLQKKVYFDFVKATTYSGTEAAEREHDIAGR